MLKKDKIRVLRDAYKQQLSSTDYSITDAWEVPIVEQLEADGILEISVAGRILGIKSYRLAYSALPIARECYTVFENDRVELIASVHDQIAALVQKMRDGAPGENSV
jgi:hypothetical protein